MVEASPSTSSLADVRRRCSTSSANASIVARGSIAGCPPSSRASGLSGSVEVDLEVLAALRRRPARTSTRRPAIISVLARAVGTVDIVIAMRGRSPRVVDVALGRGDRRRPVDGHRHRGGGQAVEPAARRRRRTASASTVLAAGLGRRSARSTRGRRSRAAVAVAADVASSPPQDARPAASSGYDDAGGQGASARGRSDDGSWGSPQRWDTDESSPRRQLRGAPLQRNRRRCRAACRAGRGRPGGRPAAGSPAQISTDAGQRAQQVERPSAAVDADHPEPGRQLAERAARRAR